MSSTTDDDGSSSEDLSNLLALADENLGRETRDGRRSKRCPRSRFRG
jgi:hypothetical protein